MTLTAMVITATITALGIYDLWAVARGGVGTSISRYMQRSALRHPLIAFAVGFVCGHIFGYMAPEPVPANTVQTESQK